jgi:hypothetical protein
LMRELGIAGCLEASPSLVYGAALLMRFGSKAHPGFESRSLRHRGTGLMRAALWAAGRKVRERGGKPVD